MTNKQKCVQYGRMYIQYFVKDVERLNEWDGISYPGFQQALANANAPAFDPIGDLRLTDPMGVLYDAAVEAAYMELQKALIERAFEALELEDEE